MPAPSVADAAEADADEGDAEAVEETPPGTDQADIDAFEEAVGDQLDELTAATEREREQAEADAASHGSSAERKEELADPVFNDPGGFFDGEDDLGEAADGMDLDGTYGREDDADADEDSDGERGQGFEDPINAGFARLAVLGLDDEYEVNGSLKAKDDLREEFREVFEEFQLGHYGNEVMHEYVVGADEDVDPIWGFCGALVLCMGLAIYMRPDGDEILSNTSERLRRFGSGLRRD